MSMAKNAAEAFLYAGATIFKMLTFLPDNLSPTLNHLGP